TISEMYITSRHPPHWAEMRWNSAKSQRRAAPIPREVESVSESVWRVPKSTSVRTSRSTLLAEAAPTISAILTFSNSGAVPGEGGGDAGIGGRREGPTALGGTGTATV